MRDIWQTATPPMNSFMTQHYRVAVAEHHNELDSLHGWADTS